MPAYTADRADRAAARDHPAGRGGVRRHGPARRLEEPRRAGRHERVVVDRAQRARGARTDRAAHPSAHVGRPDTDGRGLPLLRRRLLERPSRSPAVFELDLSEARREVEAALQATTEMLAQATRLLALVSAPLLQTETVRHVEVLLLQPRRCDGRRDHSAGASRSGSSTSTSRSTRASPTGRAQYLNEQLVGVQLGTQLLRRRLDDPGLSPVEREFVERLQPAFTELVAPTSSGSSSAAPPGSSTMSAPRRWRPTGACSSCSNGGARSSTSSPSHSIRGAVRSSASASRSAIPASTSSHSSAPPTASRTARSAPSARRAGPDGLREGDPLRPRRRSELAASRRSCSARTSGRAGRGHGLGRS